MTKKEYDKKQKQIDNFIYKAINREKMKAYDKKFRWNEDGTRTKVYDRSCRITNWKYSKMKIYDNESWNEFMIHLLIWIIVMVVGMTFHLAIIKC
tara:strand:- start:2455 stop:2739 length:285 start_codon:yes stop_codon:yes gene_type:complete